MSKADTFHGYSSEHLYAGHPLLTRATTQPSMDGFVSLNEARIQALLGHLDSALSLQSPATAQQPYDLDFSPVPDVSLRMSNLPTEPSPRDDLAYDSGLGSSIGSENKKMAGESVDFESFVSLILSPASSIRPSRANAGLGTPSVSSSATVIPKRRSQRKRASAYMSIQACRTIKDVMFDPIKRNKKFHSYVPIVNNAPARIKSGEIRCLRDLEKFMLFMATVSHCIALLQQKAHTQQTSIKSINLYREFAIYTIQAIEVAASLIPEDEHTRPVEHPRSPEEPYSNGYFANLIQQVERYAEGVKEQRRRRANGETVEEYAPIADLRTYANRPRIGTLRLHGGMSQTGQPAILVEEKEDGSLLPIGEVGKDEPSLSKDLIYTGTGVPKSGYTSYRHTFARDGSLIKREFADDGYESEMDDVYRSQARRQRQKMAEKDNGPRACSSCGKMFDRACDLTKHEKTHTRPYKCPETNCRYHEYGWPTEKEMERHWNDKHSDVPVMFRCNFPPCEYESKRESNCKQHMEKAHGWQYIRSKKSKARKGSVSQSPSSANHPTPSSEAISTPQTSTSNYEQSPLVNKAPSSNTPYLSHENSFDSGAEPEFDFNNYDANNYNIGDWNPDFNLDLDFHMGGVAAQPMPGLDMNLAEDFLTDQSMSPELFTYNNPQLFTPQHSTEQRIFDTFNDDDLYTSPTHPTSLNVQNLANPLYYSPASQGHPTIDHTFGADFRLLEPVNYDSNMTGGFFQDLADVEAAQIAQSQNNHEWMNTFMEDH
jgi:uncharacterized C2H2 Zn-finger protein